MNKTSTGLLLTAVAAVAILSFQDNAVHAADAAQPEESWRAAAAARNRARGLEGAWDIAITLPDGSATPFRILRTVTPTGIVDSYGFPPFTNTPGVVNSGGHGDWLRTSNTIYVATVKYLQLKYLAAPGFGQVIDSIGTVRETIKISDDGNSYVSEFATTITLPDGTVVLSNPGKTVAKRIVPNVPQQ